MAIEPSHGFKPGPSTQNEAKAGETKPMPADKEKSADPPAALLPRRPLGRTGQTVTLFGLGGEGVLRTFGRTREAVAVIERALDQGVNYCDTAPAYAGCLDYYGAALGERRRDIFLASKTHDRTRDGSLRLLDESLRRLRTDWLDLWQLHDLRTQADLDRLFARDGAIHALTEARDQGRVRHLGLTGHHDPAILLEAIRRFDFDTVLVALNAADVHRLSFIHTVLAEAARRAMGVIAMKVVAQGALLGPGKLSMAEAVSYVWSLSGVSTAIIGCQTIAEVDENARLARDFSAMDERTMRTLEERTRPHAAAGGYFKRGKNG
jgi:aryl-alcohol dehydrogenase-like predicted oxidoreductase